MTDRGGIFAGDDPFEIVRSWMKEAEASEPNDPNAIALATADASGMPDVRMVLLKDVDGQGEDGSFVFYTNYDSAKGQQLAQNAQAAFVMHWKSLRRQIRVRGEVVREDGPQADAYYDSRALQSRLGAWASAQSRPLDSRTSLMTEVAKVGLRHGTAPSRPPFWGGFRIRPTQIEFWADGAFRLHDRFVWTRNTQSKWAIQRLCP
ncbi:pyridoxamine 5'-phosphate oxidase [Paracoccus sp. 1_MG-2023]|uniref:pyridoxamine 5'-phosphate oxidase n=1 Tax=unclassified Paracoccus (in: a-proteobacteria) TaxID=2688777 RepID=UPI001C08176F|nr:MULTISPECIES: pyridoxamine 5'-phosphate oxidase [unclassified Paracoccus (in: a-proteobacteria)]MBU2958712.1 pyridoxamine 5'-phosphate oxidase [Paracoccus sp. C2R09]MDO6667705.1 pyridoxamine 5'-phosphate oxidase [Paracoccus sp. 1_MG-2023]